MHVRIIPGGWVQWAGQGGRNVIECPQFGTGSGAVDQALAVKDPGMG